MNIYKFTRLLYMISHNKINKHRQTVHHTAHHFFLSSLTRQIDFTIFIDFPKIVWFSTMSQPQKISAYQRFICRIACSLPKRIRPFFLHPAGPTTVFFWAPTFKWGLVLAGIGDIKRPPDTISLAQTSSLMITGAIWSRYSLVVTPKNYNLFSVNAFTSIVGAYNFVRGLMYQLNIQSK